MPLPHDPYASQDPFAVDSKGTVVPEPDAPTDIAVPKGTSSEVASWVGDDKERAQLALDAENSADRPRKGLVDALEEILEK